MRVMYMINILIDLCNDSRVLRILYLIEIITKIICIAVPIILIVTLMIDLTKAIMDSDDKKIASIKRTSINKIIAAIVVFLIPTFVSLFLSLFSFNEYANCVRNITMDRIKEAEAAEKKQKEKDREAALAEQQQNIDDFNAAGGDVKHTDPKPNNGGGDTTPTPNNENNNGGGEYNNNENNETPSPSPTPGTVSGSIVTINLKCSIWTPVNSAADEYYSDKLMVNAGIKDDFQKAMDKVCELYKDGAYGNKLQHAGAYVSTSQGTAHPRGLAIDMMTFYHITKDGKTYYPYSVNTYKNPQPYIDFICNVCHGDETCPENVLYQLYEKAFKPNNFCWGRNWSSKYFDPMHFEHVNNGSCSLTPQVQITCN